MKISTKFKVFGYLEGLSFLLLLGIAMPLKYLYHQPLAVKYVGWVHGLLFVIYVYSAWDMLRKKVFSEQEFVGAIVAAILPFGPFVYERKLHKRHEESA